ncbi:MAG: Molybdopterin-guanine dinucleotide biosynthesis adapter protein [Alphaproteobacteria bacterium MarineAlpha10_Bin3]|jgi:molybdopterin-guanine dinucleotide biosynthesis protein B|nr:MAG: Molybdopterin-guanine dinucleotide biosynthesis adapter protein [Alphaproteobacteria bacterium MarineAlpha10_Bin3]PPR70661.1 MAG: Molybdopterin-guanine dinucleotide biosynthesis adapter protein [Alphaproteobacteria bacterium MarineAlpha4_Bin1]
MKIFGLAGWKGSGKTTLVVRLLPELISRGYSVSTLKHAHHDFDIDKPGKDSFEHRHAGATEVMVTSARRWALMHENRDAPEPGVAEITAHMSPVDLLLIEGFKHHAHPKLEIHRPSTGHALLCRDDRHIVAVASDAPLPDVALPVLDLNDFCAIADFIAAHLNLDQGRAHGAA